MRTPGMVSDGGGGEGSRRVTIDDRGFLTSNAGKKRKRLIPTSFWERLLVGDEISYKTWHLKIFYLSTRFREKLTCFLKIFLNVKVIISSVGFGRG